MSGKDLYNQTIVISIKENDIFNSDDAFPASFLSLGKMLRQDANHRYEVEALEYRTFKAMADPVELCGVLCIEHLWG